MHLYFMIRGILTATDIFKMFMQTQMWTWKRKDLKTGKDEIILVQGALRECGFLYEYIFPEEHFDEVCTMLNRGGEFIDNATNLGLLRNWGVRKVLGHGVKKIPKFKEVQSNKFIQMHGVAFYPIGIKYDKKREVEEWGVEQEML